LVKIYLHTRTNPDAQGAPPAAGGIFHSELQYTVGVFGYGDVRFGTNTIARPALRAEPAIIDNVDVEVVDLRRHEWNIQTGEG
jgi:hypothetical protein